MGGHRGKRLGHVVTAAVLHRLKALGYSRCAIITTTGIIMATPTTTTTIMMVGGYYIDYP